MSEVIYLSDVRLSFPNLAEPQKRKNEQTGEERISYNCELIMPEQHAGYQAFMQRFAALAAEKGKEHANALMQMIHGDRKSRCYGTGAEKINKRTFQPYDGYAGMVFITVGNKNRPQVIGQDGKPVDSDNTMAYQALTRKLYGGCRVNAAIKPWWQNANPQKQIGHGIRCDLIAIQFLRDDAPFGDPTPDASGLFGAVQGAPAAAAVPGAMPWAQPAAPQMPAPPFAQGAPGLPPFMAR
jgi:hypothetical protein